MGVARGPLGWAIRWVGLSLRPLVHRNRVLVTAGLGVLVGLTATVYQLITGQQLHARAVLRAGRPPGRSSPNAADYTVAVLVVLGALQDAAYGLSLSAFRGGPVFPAMFIGAVLGMAVSGLPGMDLAAGDRDGHRRACAARCSGFR